MITPKTIELHAAKDPARRVALRYRELPLTHKQARFVGRHNLAPELDLSEYQCRAVIDWVMISFVIGRPTQFRYVQASLEDIMGRRSWVEPLRPQPGGVATEFAVTFQEPTLALLQECRQVIADDFGEASVPFVNEMEISVDFTPKVPSYDARSRMVAVLSRHLLPNRDVLTSTSDRPRFSWGRGRLKNSYLMKVSKLEPFDANRFANVSGDVPAPVDATYYAGNRRLRAMWRVMDKIIDRQSDGTWIDLPDEEKRARIEVKLDRFELYRLGLETVDQLMKFNFARLQGTFFKFMLPTFLATGVSMHPADRYWEQERMKRFLNVGVIGLQAMDQWRGNERKKHRPALVSYLKARKIPASEVDRRGAGISARLVAYQDLNDRVSMALRKLVERERRGIGVE